MTQLDKFKGCILGCALGDAVGAWAEAKSPKECANYVTSVVRTFKFEGVGEHHHGMKFGQYTDDTQLTRELTLSLTEEGDWVPEDFADRIATAFAQNRVVGYGRATQEAAVRLQEGTPWNQAGTPPPRAGNGAAMRAGPVGLFWSKDLERLITVAQEQAIITHQAELSVAGSVAIAVAVAMLLNASRDTSGPHERGWWAWLARFVKRSSPDFGQDIDKLADRVFARRRTKTGYPGDDGEYDVAYAWCIEGDDPRWEGISPWARPSVLWSLYCLMAQPTSVWKALELAIMPGGDVDTTAAMAGTLVGAHVGLQKFPEQVIHEVAPQIHDRKAPEWGWSALEKLAEELHQVVTSHSPTSNKDEGEIPILKMFGEDS